MTRSGKLWTVKEEYRIHDSPQEKLAKKQHRARLEIEYRDRTNRNSDGVGQVEIESFLDYVIDEMRFQVL